MAIVDTVWGRLARFNAPQRDRAQHRPFPILSVISLLRWGLAVSVLVAAAWLVAYETRTSGFESQLFTDLDGKMNAASQPGPSRAIRYPKSGPYDERLGYTQLPDFITALTAHRYGIDAQARWSPAMARFVGLGTFPVYREKDQAGLRIYDRSG